METGLTYPDQSVYVPHTDSLKRGCGDLLEPDLEHSQLYADTSLLASSSSSRKSRYYKIARKFFSKIRRLASPFQRKTRGAAATSVSQFCYQNNANVSLDVGGSHQHSFLDQSLATIRTASFYRQKGSSRIEILDETWEDWLEKYQRGDQNLSEVSRPTCFGGFGYMAPPVHKNEGSRLKVVNRVKDLRIWAAEQGWIKSELRRVLTEFKIKAGSVSVIDGSTQQTYFEHGFGCSIDTIGRELSLDAHAILSKCHFVLRDASSDWRTRLNPLVHGPPFIKFYAGIPLIIAKQPVGCVSVCDPFLKVHVVPKLLEKLAEVSAKMSVRLEARITKESSWYLPKIEWDHNYRVTQPPTGLPFGNTNKKDTHMDQNVREDSESEHGSIGSDLSCATGSMSNHRLFASSVPMHISQLQRTPTKALIQPFEVFESLLKCQSVNQVIKKACRMVSRNLDADVVYVAEVRNADRQIKRNDQDYPDISRLLQNAQVRWVGHCTPSIDISVERSVEMNSDLLISAVASPYGVSYSAGENGDQAIKTGLAMPFRRKSTSASHKILPGGFVMGAFSAVERTVSSGDKAFMKKVVLALENILSCLEEVRSV